MCICSLGQYVSFFTAIAVQIVFIAFFRSFIMGVIAISRYGSSGYAPFSGYIVKSMHFRKMV